MNLFLDDIRDPKDVYWVQLPLVEWKIVRNYNEFCSWVETNGLPKFISYDHDLGDEATQEALRQNFEGFDYSRITEKTGYDCCKFIINRCLDLKIKHPDYSVHSINPIGKENIERLIENYNAQSYV